MIFDRLCTKCCRFRYAGCLPNSAHKDRKGLRRWLWARATVSAMTDYPGSEGQDAARAAYPPPPGQSLPQAPPVPAGYGYDQYAQQTGRPGMYFDQQASLELPNGTELASSGRRIGAYFLAIPLWIVTLGLGYIVWGLILWGRGQTPALKMLGMQVWRPDEQRPATFWYMALREIVGRIGDGILSFITGLLSFILMLATPQRKTIHDYIAGTVVLYDPNKVLQANRNQS